MSREVQFFRAPCFTHPKGNFCTFASHELLHNYLFINEKNEITLQGCMK